MNTQNNQAPVNGTNSNPNSKPKPMASASLDAALSQHARTGKIARLPAMVREELNLRLLDGMPADELLEWLNSLDETQEVLAYRFDQQPINKQNLSAWRQGGFREWQRRLQVEEVLGDLGQHADNLDQLGHGRSVADGLSLLVASELLVSFRALTEEEAPERRWQLMKEMVAMLTELRREDRRSAKVREALHDQRQERDRTGQERELQEWFKRLDKPIERAQRMSQLTAVYGGGETGRKHALERLAFEEQWKAKVEKHIKEKWQKEPWAEMLDGIYGETTQAAAKP